MYGLVLLVWNAQYWIAIFVGLIIFLFIFHCLVRWIQDVLLINIVRTVQGLVDQIKEYDLDTRAGLLICSGSNLHIHYMDRSLVELLGSKKCVDDILLPSTRAKHRQTVARYIDGQSLPDSLNHPLRNVPIRSKDGEVLRAKVIIGKFQLLSKRFMRDIFYVIIQPCEGQTIPSKRLSFLKNSTAGSGTSLTLKNQQLSRDEISILEKEPSDTSLDSSRDTSCVGSEFGSDCQALVEAYGIGAISYIGRGLVPATERYSQATVLYVDIVNFTRHCAMKGLDEISGWMTEIHSTIDTLLEQHAVRKVETRGDCCICVSGTNFACDENAPTRDLSSTQTTRMLSFSHDLGLALSALDGTEVRMGMATGSVVLTHISHGGDALPAKYIYGDTVNVACRMEQTGRVGALQLSESAARAYAEATAMALPPLQTRMVKGKGAMRTAFYSYFDGCFLPAATET